jgi:hypothetical protein
MDSPDEARRHAREHDLDVPHECGKCGREYDCLVIGAWYSFERECKDHYQEHEMNALCDACLEGAESP